MAKYAVIFPELKKKLAYLFGEGVSLSYPLPDRIGGIRVDCFFLYYSGLKPLRTRPFGRLIVESESGRILRFEDCRVSDFVDTEAHPLKGTIDYSLPVQISVKDLMVHQSLMAKLYEVVRERAFAEELTEKEKEIFVKYAMLMEKLTPKDLVPYYLAIGKNFYEWGF